MRKGIRPGRHANLRFLLMLFLLAAAMSVSREARGADIGREQSPAKAQAWQLQPAGQHDKNLLDLSEKLNVAISKLESERAAAVKTFLSAVAGNPPAPEVNVERALKAYRDWKELDDGYAERIDALKNILKKTETEIAVQRR